ncbi:MAG TPA: hypothetical protein DCS91_18455 [Microcoleaceae bacterium UBA11344]|nr:hypothetical protein [Microcoleaceae cyanobacterium UBA11344]
MTRIDADEASLKFTIFNVRPGDLLKWGIGVGLCPKAKPGLVVSVLIRRRQGQAAIAPVVKPGQ